MYRSAVRSGAHPLPLRVYLADGQRVCLTQTVRFPDRRLSACLSVRLDVSSRRSRVPIAFSLITEQRFTCVHLTVEKKSR
jgi:hypothetical protein